MKAIFGLNHDHGISKAHLMKVVVIGILMPGILLVGVLWAGISTYYKLTNNTIIAYFPEIDALYPGDKVQIMGVPVGLVDKIEPDGNRLKVTFHYANKYKVPANASAVILNPTLVASRVIQLDPPYRGGKTLANHAEIPLERTRIPVQWDTLRKDIYSMIREFGPTPEQPKGPFGDVIEAFADGLAGKGAQFNKTFSSLSDALTTLNNGRGDFFGVVRDLALFVNALAQNDQQLNALNNDLAQFTGNLTRSDHDLADAISEFDQMMKKLRPFLKKNHKLLVHDTNNFAELTTRLLQPDSLDGFETVLHVAPTALSNLTAIYHPATGSVTSAPVLPNFANPMQLICSAIQAGSRLGYQDSAELCAQYLAPILDAIKFNHLPFGLNLFNTSYVTPKMVAYSEPRLQPPPGYKDTTVPGIWVPDTPLSHRNTQPGWVVAPGMQGVQPGHDTERLLTPESLAALLGGPDPEPFESQYQTPPGYPNAYNEDTGPLPYAGMNGPAHPLPPPPPAQNVIPGPVDPIPAGAGR